MEQPRESDAVVAVVDDDVSAREGLQSLIRSAGWRAETFGSAQEFLARAPALRSRRRNMEGTVFADAHATPPRTTFKRHGVPWRRCVRLCASAPATSQHPVVSGSGRGESLLLPLQKAILHRVS